MMTLLEDLGLALRQVCRAIGLSGNAVTIVPPGCTGSDAECSCADRDRVCAEREAPRSWALRAAECGTDRVEGRADCGVFGR